MRPGMSAPYPLSVSGFRLQMTGKFFIVTIPAFTLSEKTATLKRVLSSLVSPIVMTLFYYCATGFMVNVTIGAVVRAGKQLPVLP